jgi:hypothetical protein
MDVTQEVNLQTQDVSVGMKITVKFLNPETMLCKKCYHIVEEADNISLITAKVANTVGQPLSIYYLNEDRKETQFQSDQEML